MSAKLVQKELDRAFLDRELDLNITKRKGFKSRISASDLRKIAERLGMGRPCSERILFSLAEIAEAVGTKVVFQSGISYGVLKLHVPLTNDRILELRQGDAKDDHKARIINREEEALC